MKVLIVQRETRSEKWISGTIFVFIILGALFSGCSSNQKGEFLAPSPPTKASGQDNSSSLTPVQDGRSIFLANCIGCHGRDANGNTAAGRAWHVPDLHSPKTQALSDEQLMQILRTGKGRMPAWNGMLSDIDLAHVLAYIRSLKTKS